jgi:hypothetical protein
MRQGFEISKFIFRRMGDIKRSPIGRRDHCYEDQSVNAEITAGHSENATKYIKLHCVVKIQSSFVLRQAIRTVTIGL